MIIIEQQKQWCYFKLIYKDGTVLKSRANGAPEYVRKYQYIGRNGLVDVEFYDHNYETKKNFKFQ